MSTDAHVNFAPEEDALNLSNFKERLNYEVDRAKRFGRPLSVCVFSVDNREKFAADRHNLLKQLAQVIRSVLRTVDLMVASSSDDLAIILPETDLPGALIAAERVLTEIKQTPFSLEGSSINVTASAAAGTYPEHGLDADSLATKTIEALRGAQDQGGSRVASVQ